MMIKQDYPCKKLIELLLLEHCKSIWKVNQKITYKKFLPHSKQFINSWIAENLFGPTKLMLLENIKSITKLSTLESRYKKFHPDLWRILDDPTLREQVELDLLYCHSPEDVYDRLNFKIKPRVIDMRAVKQFQYYFWNLDDVDGVFRPVRVLKLIESNRELSKAFRHIIKYYNDKNGQKKYEYHYHLNNSDEPDLTKINAVINLTSIEQIDSFDKGNIDKIETLTDIQLKNSLVLKNLASIQNNSEKQNFSDIVDFKE